MLSELLTELELRRKDREAGFLTVARKLAAGEKVATSTVEKLLADTGKTPAALSEAGELFRQRFEWHEQRRKAAAMEKERSTVQDRIAAEGHKLELAEQAHAEATAPLRARLEGIKAAVSEASDARRQLIATCPDPKLKADLADVQARLHGLRSRERALRERADLIKRAERDEEEARAHEAGLVPGSDPRKAPHWREQAVRDREAGEKAKAELPGVRKQIAALECDEAAVYERMTQP